jgi:hypothetical protein
MRRTPGTYVVAGSLLTSPEALGASGGGAGCSDGCKAAALAGAVGSGSAFATWLFATWLRTSPLRSGAQVAAAFS